MIGLVPANAWTKHLEAESRPYDDAGLKGILEGFLKSGNIRLRSVSTLNDPAELTRGFSYDAENHRAVSAHDESRIFAPAV